MPTKTDLSVEAQYKVFCARETFLLLVDLMHYVLRLELHERKTEARRHVIMLMMYDTQQEQSSNLPNIINHLEINRK